MSSRGEARRSRESMFLIRWIGMRWNGTKKAMDGWMDGWMKREDTRIQLQSHQRVCFWCERPEPKVRVRRAHTHIFTQYTQGDELMSHGQAASEQNTLLQEQDEWQPLAIDEIMQQATKGLHLARDTRVPLLSPTNYST
jgi:hypothetical protein